MEPEEMETFRFFRLDLMTLLMTPMFGFHWVVSSLKTPTMTSILTLLLLKTKLYRSHYPEDSEVNPLTLMYRTEIQYPFVDHFTHIKQIAN